MAAVGTDGDQRVQVGLAADPGQVAALGQLVGDGDRVGRLAAAVEVEDRVVDQLVRRAVEVVALEHLDAVGDGVLGQQHAAEHGLLGVDVLRRHPVVGTVTGTGVAAHVQLGDRHAAFLSNLGDVPLSDSRPEGSDIPLWDCCPPTYGRGATLGPAAPPHQTEPVDNLGTTCAARRCAVCTVWGQPCELSRDPAAATHGHVHERHPPPVDEEKVRACPVHRSAPTNDVDAEAPQARRGALDSAAHPHRRRGRPRTAASVRRFLVPTYAATRATVYDDRPAGVREPPGAPNRAGRKPSSKATLPTPSAPYRDVALHAATLPPRVRREGRGSRRRVRER